MTRAGWLWMVPVGFAVGCDFSGDDILNTVEGIPAVYQIGGVGVDIIPSVVASPEDIRAATYYGELVPSNTAELGGASFTFEGTGGTVCVWVDPEAAAWNAAISRDPQEGTGSENPLLWQYPDNVFDDGDVDVLAGLSVFYTGSPSRIGDFNVRHRDELGAELTSPQGLCPSGLNRFGEIPTAGRGVPEYCDIDTSGNQGVSFTVALSSFAVPVDDSRLGYALLVAEGSCESVFGSAIADPVVAECFITGEALIPERIEGDEASYQPTMGASSVRGRVWSRFTSFEEAFCDTDVPMAEYCEREAADVLGAGKACSWEHFDADDFDPEERCFCGDPASLPTHSGF